MEPISKQVKNILKENNTYEYDISSYCEAISYIPYFQEIEESDYIIYHEDRSFEYTAQFYSFVKSLFDAKLVEDVEVMKSFLTTYNSESPYKLWLKDMNLVLEDEDLLKQTNISFLKKTILSVIRLEYVLPGSWGIDVEAGNWLKILEQLKNILPQITNSKKENIH